MPTNTPIPSKAVNAVLASSEWNTLLSLNSGTGVYAAGGAWLGTPPPRTAPNFLISAGYGVVTFSGGIGTVLFTGFPNGILAVTVTGNAGSGTDVTLTTQGTAALNAVGVYATSAGSPFTGGIGVHYIIIGW